MLSRAFKIEKKEWPLWLLKVLLVLGVFVSTQLTLHHENQLYGNGSAKLSFCPENTVINCDLVNSSAYSELGGIPIAVFGVSTYLFLLVLLVFRGKIKCALFITSFLGILASLYSVFLAGISHFQIGYFCLWCMALYGINFSIPLLVYCANGISPWKMWREEASSSLAALPLLFVLMGATVFGQKTYRSSLKHSSVAQSNFQFPAAFTKPVLNAKDRMGEEAFSLQDKVGRGQLLAVMFLTPGQPFSDDFALKAKKIFSSLAPQAHLVAVSPVATGSQMLEDIWEDYSQLPGLKDTQLLFDNEFKVGRALGIQLAPSLMVVDADGTLVATNLQQFEVLSQMLEQAARKEKLKLIGDARNLAQGPEAEAQCAIPFKLNDLLTRKEVRFNPQEKQKKPTLLVFWNALCKHCQIEIPKLMALSQKYHDPFRVLSISRLRPGNESGLSHRELTEKYLKEIQFPWPVLVDSGIVSALYKVDSTPTTVVISPEGVIQEVWKGVQPHLEQKFESASRKVASMGKENCQAQREFSKSALSFSLQDSQGKSVEIRELITKPSLIHFSDKKCQACQEELPKMERFSLEAKQRGIDTIEVSMDKDAHSAFHSPQGGIFDEINAGYHLPRTYLVNEKGEVLKKYIGPQNWIDETFKELAFTWFQ